MGKLKSIFIGILVFIINILVATLIVLNCTPLYKVAIKAFSLEKLTGLTSDVIFKDYRRIINYINIPSMDNLSFDNFTLSNNGAFHFKEVKIIFLLIYVFVFIAIIAAILILFLKKDLLLNYKIYRNAFICNIILATMIILFAAYDFTVIFEGFHAIMFSNTFWIFDVVDDSIINILPEEYFFSCTLMILLLSLSINFIGWKLCKKLKRNNKDKNILYN